MFTITSEYCNVTCIDLEYISLPLCLFDGELVPDYGFFIFDVLMCLDIYTAELKYSYRMMFIDRFFSIHGEKLLIYSIFNKRRYNDYAIPCDGVLIRTNDVSYYETLIYKIPDVLSIDVYIDEKNKIYAIKDDKLVEVLPNISVDTLSDGIYSLAIQDDGTINSITRRYDKQYPNDIQTVELYLSNIIK